MSYLKHNFVLRPLLSFVCHLVSVVIFSKVSEEFGVWDLGFSGGKGGKGKRERGPGLSAVVFQCQSHSGSATATTTTTTESCFCG